MSFLKTPCESVEERLLRAEASLEALSRGEADLLIGAKEPLIVRFKSLVEEKERQALLLETLIETAPTLILQTDSQRRIVRFNGACEQLTGHSRAEVLGLSITELYPDLGWTDIVAEAVAAKLARSQHPAATVPHVGHWTSKMGEKRLIEWRCTAHASPDNAGYFVLGIGLDITERARSLELVAESRRYAESIIATVREPLLVLDGSLRVEAVNQSFYRAFQVGPEETLGCRLYELGDQQWNIPKLRQLLETILPENASFDHFEVERIFPDIGRRTFVLNARRVQHAKRIEKILLGMEDVTEHRRASETVRRQAGILQSILDTAGDGIAVADEHGKFLFFNPAAERILGLGEVEGGPEAWSQRYALYMPDGITPYPPAEIPLAKAMRGESVDEAEMIVRNQRSCEDAWISVTARPLASEKGGVRGGVVVFRHITNFKRLEQELRSTSDQLRHITAASPAILYTMRVDGDSLIPTWYSANAVTIFGYAMDEMLDSAWWLSRLHPDDHAAVLAGVASLQHSDRISQEYRFLRKDDSILWIRNEMRAARNPAGQILQIVGASLDITERKSLEAEMAFLQKPIAPTSLTKKVREVLDK